MSFNTSFEFKYYGVCVQSITVISSHPECRNARNVERGARRSELGAQSTMRGGVHSGDDIENPGIRAAGHCWVR